MRRQEPCVDLIRENGRIVGVITTTGEYSAKLTVIANGARSSMRDRYLGKPSYYEYPVSFFNTCFKLLPEYADAGYYVIGEEGVMIMVPLPNDQMRIGIQFDHSEGVAVSDIRAAIRKRLKTISVASLEYIDAHVYRIFKSLSESWWIPGAVLVGDAAHTTHPAGAQGMNLAFQDAESLAQCLVNTDLRSPDLIDDACAAYSRQRYREVKRVLLRTHLMGLAGMIRWPLFIRTRERILRLTNRIVPLKRRVFQRIIEVR